MAYNKPGYAFSEEIPSHKLMICPREILPIEVIYLDLVNYSYRAGASSAEIKLVT